MKFCNQCGQGNADDAGFCVQCGGPLQETAPPQAPPAMGASPEGQAPPAGQAPPPPGAPPAAPQFAGAAPPPPGMPAGQTPPPPGGPGVPPPGYAPAYRTQVPTDGMAVASLVAGIVSWFFCPLIAAILAIIFGYMAKRNIRESNGALQGEGFATAGIILGFVNLAVFLLVVIIIIIVAIVAGTTNTTNLVTPTLLAALM